MTEQRAQYQSGNYPPDDSTIINDALGLIRKQTSYEVVVEALIDKFEITESKAKQMAGAAFYLASSGGKTTVDSTGPSGVLVRERPKPGGSLREAMRRTRTTASGGNIPSSSPSDDAQVSSVKPNNMIDGSPKTDTGKLDRRARRTGYDLGVDDTGEGEPGDPPDDTPTRLDRSCRFPDGSLLRVLVEAPPGEPKQWPCDASQAAEKIYTLIQG